MVEAAKCGQLSTIRQLLDGGASTVEDQDEVKGVYVLLWTCVERRVPCLPMHMCVHTVKIMGFTPMLAYHFGPFVPLVPLLRGFSFR